MSVKSQESARSSAHFFRIGTIRTRLLVSFVALVLLLAIVIIAISAWRGMRDGQQRALDHLELVTAFKEVELNVWIDDLQRKLAAALDEADAMLHARTALKTLKSNPQAEVAELGASVSSRFFFYVQRTGWFEEAFLLDLQGKKVAATGITALDDSHADQPYFQEGLKGPYASFYSPSPNQVRILASQPLRDEFGTTLGVLVGYTGLDQVNEILLERTGLGETGWAYLVGSDHDLLTPPRTNEIEPMPVHTTGVSEALETRDTYAGLYEDYRGVPVVGVDRWLPQLRAALVIEQDQSEAFGTIRDTLAINVGVTLLAALIAVLASLLVTRSIAAPIARLTRTATAIAAGDLERVASVEREDEIGTLARAFNSMTDQLRGLIDSLEQRVSDLRQTEKALRESQQTLQRVIENMPVLFDAFDENGVALFWNKECERVTSYSAEEIVGNPDALELLCPDPEYRAWVMEQLQELGHDYRDWEIEIQRKDGETRTIAWANTSRYHPIPGWWSWGVGVDVTKRVRAEQALRESEARYRDLFENSPISLWEQDFSAVKQRIDALSQQGVTDFRAFFEAHPEVVAECIRLIKNTAMNEASLKLYGASSKAELLTGLDQLIPLEGHHTFRDELVWIAQGRTRFEWQGVNHTLAGDRIDVRGHWSVAPGCEHTLSQVLVSIEDITERVQAEEALRESESRYRTLFEQANDALFLGKIETDEIVDANRRACELTGYTREELLTMRVPDLQAPEVRGPAGSVLKAELELYRGRPFETMNTHRDGTRIPVEVSTSQMTGTGGELTLGIVRDITERVRAEQALRQSEEKYRTLFESSPESITLIGLDGTILDCNAATAKISGSSRDEMIGRHFSEIGVLGQADLPKYADLFSQVTSGEDVKPLELQVIHSGSDTRWVEAFPALLKRDGDVYAIQVISRDVTERVQAEQALRESGERYRSLFDGVPVGLNRTTPAGQILDANPALVQMLGYPDRETLLSANAADTYANPEDRKQWMALIEREGTVRNFEVQLRRHDGTVIWTRSSAHAVLDADGRVLYYEGSLEDITERVRSEQALRESEERFRKIFEEGPLGMGVLSPDDRFIRANATLCRMVGYTEKELQALTYVDITHPEDIDASEQLAYQLLSGKLPHLQTEKRYVTRNGQTLWINLTATFIHDNEGTPLYKLTMIEDITERIRAAEERERLLEQIQNQARQVQQIVDTVPEGVILLDADSRIRVANPVARKALASLTDADVGDPLTHLGPQSLDGLLARHAAPLPIEITLPHPSRRVFEAQARPVGEGQNRQWVLTLREVTQEREIQQQMQRQERLATVGQLAAGIAHDFNNIMSSIVLYSGILLRSPNLSSSERDRMNVIRQQGHRAANLVQQILDFARRSVLERKPLDLVPFLKELEKLLVRTLPENIYVYVDYGHEDYVVNADPTRIQQVIMNLALNARDAMPGGGELRFDLSLFELRPGEPAPFHDMSPGEWVRLTVNDTGTGIPPEALPHIFEPFFTTKEVGQGTGLGLAQVYGIVRQHEGRIDVESQIGIGTSFVIYLPALTLPEVAPEAPLEGALVEGGGETVLVVEDDATTRTAISEILNDLGYRVLTAANGQEALALFGEEVALVLSDLVMPEIGGGTLHAALKEMQPQVKMIIMTGYPVADGGKELLEQGVASWIKKPFSADEIAQVVREALE